MKTVKIDMGLCERLVEHAKRLDGAVEAKFLSLIKAVFCKNSGDVLFKRKYKEMEISPELHQALKNVDKEILESLLCDFVLCTTTANIYRDFTTLRMIIG